jgi:hypothetical protein
MSDIFPIQNVFKQGDNLSLLNLNIVLEYAFRSVQGNWEGLKWNCTHQLLVYADYVNILGESVHTIKTEALVVASKKNGLEGNAEKATYMVLSRYQNTVQKSHDRAWL